jgi:hypothetical protein
MRSDANTVAAANRKAPLGIFDPYSQQMIAYTKPDEATSGGDHRRGASMASRLLQLVLLSSVVVIAWYMFGILQTTG